jgi:polar amino acid transport system substrate-binding protein
VIGSHLRADARDGRIWPIIYLRSIARSTSGVLVMSSRISFSVQLVALLALAGCGEGERPGSAVPEQAAAPAAQPAAADCALTMGWDPWEPYQYRDVGGDVHGLDVEIVSAIADMSDCRLSFVSSDWATLLDQLRNGDLDILTGATRNEQREQFAFFTDPYRDESFRLYVRAGEADEHASAGLEELLDAGFRLGVTQEYLYGGEVAALEQDPKYADQFVPAAIGEVNYSRLLNNEIDGFLEDPYVAATVLRRKGLTGDIKAHPFVINTDPVSLMISKASVPEETAQRINASLAQLKSSDAYQAILDKYLDAG